MVSTKSYVPLLLALIAVCAQGVTLGPRNAPKDIACIGNLTPTCCSGGSVDDGGVLTGCQRYDSSAAACQPKGQVYCCQSLDPGVPGVTGDEGVGCQNYYSENS